jgi:hypothetical protein
LETDYSGGKKPHDKTDHPAITTALGMMEEPKDPGLHIRKHHHTIVAILRSMEEIDDLGRCVEHLTIHVRDAMNTITQSRVNRSLYERDKRNCEYKEIEMGDDCFTHRVHRTQVPKGFKLPHDHQKYDGSHEPESWSSDYPQAVKILEGSKAQRQQQWKFCNYI